MAIDPVCRMQLKKNNATAQSVYHRRKYYFCTPSCKESFDKDPERYLLIDAVSKLIKKYHERDGYTAKRAR